MWRGGRGEGNLEDGRGDCASPRSAGMLRQSTPLSLPSHRPYAISLIVRCPRKRENREAGDNPARAQRCERGRWSQFFKPRAFGLGLVPLE